VSFIRRQIDEIAGDAVLRRYGAALALTHALSAIFWLDVQPLGRILDPALMPVCWPFFPQCHAWRILDPAAITGLVVLLLALALVTSARFVRAETVRSGYWLLMAATLLKTVLLVQDYRLVLNQHYMAGMVVCVFLFVPAKRQALAYLITSFYVWAGLLKLNPEWMSGVALYGRRPFGLPASVIPATCLYVIVLELFVVFGLLSKRPWVFWVALGQVLLFHIGSFWVVGYFYPILMFLILSILAMTTLDERVRAHTPLAGTAPGHRRRIAVSTYGLLATFSLLQLIPRSFPGNPSITGEGRLFALNMFDAPVQCQATVTVHAEGVSASPRRLGAPFLQPRIQCDPIVYFELARGLCRSNELNPRFGDIDIRLTSRKQGQADYRTVVAIDSFCAAHPSYDLLRHNAWIQAR